MNEHVSPSSSCYGADKQQRNLKCFKSVTHTVDQCQWCLTFLVSGLGGQSPGHLWADPVAGPNLAQGGPSRVPSGCVQGGRAHSGSNVAPRGGGRECRAGWKQV